MDESVQRTRQRRSMWLSLSNVVHWYILSKSEARYLSRRKINTEKLLTSLIIWKNYFYLPIYSEFRRRICHHLFANNNTMILWYGRSDEQPISRVYGNSDGTERAMLLSQTVKITFRFFGFLKWPLVFMQHNQTNSTRSFVGRIDFLEAF
jgi:hypothetical protein